MQQNRPTFSPPEAPKFIGAIFGFVFFGIGLTVLIFLWSMPFDEFGSPPLFFRLFGSFIAIAFLGIGGTVAYGAITANRRTSQMAGEIFERAMSAAAPDASKKAEPHANVSAAYVCPNCAAPLAANADVSPLGDVKCGHCGGWFNIHGRRA